MKRASILTVLLLCFSGTEALAGCDLSYTRTACPGKEAISYKKCDGKQSCVKSVSVASAEACRVKAVAACENDRLDITKSKVLTATFNGKPVLNKAGGVDHCQDYSEREAEFNKCN
jgi:hypothetical protein